MAGSTALQAADYHDQLKKFYNIVGLNYNEGDGKPKRVLLRVYHKHLKYLQSLPLHNSQQIDWQEGEEYGTARYLLIPNYELRLEILKMGAFVEVLEPKTLRQEIKTLLLNTLDHYQ